MIANSRVEGTVTLDVRGESRWEQYNREVTKTKVLTDGKTNYCGVTVKSTEVLNRENKQRFVRRFEDLIMWVKLGTTQT